MTATDYKRAIAHERAFKTTSKEKGFRHAETDSSIPFSTAKGRVLAAALVPFLTAISNLICVSILRATLIRLSTSRNGSRLRRIVIRQACKMGLTLIELDAIEYKIAKRMLEHPRLLTKSQLWTSLGLSVATIDRYVNRRVIPVLRLGSRVMFDPQRVVEALESPAPNASLSLVDSADLQS